MNDLIKNITTINLKSTDTIVLRFNDVRVDEIKRYVDYIQNIFPNNQIVVLPKYVDLEVASKELWEDYICMVSDAVQNIQKY